ncbi:hypothetical protein EJB05_23228, partial [Eragrostis curvula]
MAFNKKAAVVAVPLVLLLVSHCADAVKICTAVSQTFHGNCVSNKNCASACYDEYSGMAHGYCSKRRICSKSLNNDDLNDIGLNFSWNRRCKHPCKCSFACGALPSPGTPGEGPPEVQPPPGEGPPEVQPPPGDSPPVVQPPAGKNDLSFSMTGPRVPN